MLVVFFGGGVEPRGYGGSYGGVGPSTRKRDYIRRKRFGAMFGLEIHSLLHDSPEHCSTSFWLIEAVNPPLNLPLGSSNFAESETGVDASGAGIDAGFIPAVRAFSALSKLRRGINSARRDFQSEGGSFIPRGQIANAWI